MTKQNYAHLCGDNDYIITCPCSPCRPCYCEPIVDPCEDIQEQCLKEIKDEVCCDGFICACISGGTIEVSFKWLLCHEFKKLLEIIKDYGYTFYLKKNKVIIHEE